MKKLLVLIFSFSLSAHNIHQEKTNLDGLLKDAQDTQTRMVAILKSLDSHHIIDPGIKGMKTIERLLKTRWHNDASAITDYCRATIVVDTLDQIYPTITKLEDHFKIVSIDDHYAEPFPEMYRDINVVFQDPINNHIGEIQINSVAMTNFKDTYGHRLFDEIRTIKALGKLENRTLSPEENQHIDTLTILSKQGYNEAYDMSHPNTRIGIYGICIQDNKVLMVKTMCGNKVIYNFPGGGAHKDEGFFITLKRECQEEIGCNVAVGKLIGANTKTYYSDYYKNSTFSIYYTIFPENIDYSLNGAEWFDLDNMPIDIMLESDKDILHLLK